MDSKEIAAHNVTGAAEGLKDHEGTHSPGHVIDISATGRVEAMHNDSFDLGFLGPQSISRASDIRFDESSQKWGIWIVDNGEYLAPSDALKGFRSYESARQFEVSILNVLRLNGTPPASKEAEDIIQGMRSTVDGVRDGLGLPSL